MINITQDIHSLTDFKKNTHHFIHDLKKSGRPTVLTVNGKAELVVMDALTYQKMQERLEFETVVSEVNQSIRDFDDGKFSSSKTAFGDLKRRIKGSKKVKK